MRILHVITSIDPSRGGPSVCAPSLAAAQAHLGHEVFFAHYSSGSHQEISTDTEKNIDYNEELKMIEVIGSGHREKLIASQAAKALTDIIPSCDIVHMHGIWDPIVIRAALLALKLRKSYVITPHGMLNPWCLAQKRIKKTLAFYAVTKKLLKGSAFVHALNTTEAEAIKSVCKHCTTKIFPNGVFPSKHEHLPGKGAFYRELPSLNGRPYILFLGRLHYVKGLDFAAEAFAGLAKRIDNLDLVIAGPDSGAQADFEKRIAAHNIRHRVHILGPIYGIKKYAAMADALCFLQPSRQEGFSMSILEAMACGTPVVISENCHFPEVGGLGCGAVVPLEIHALRDALIRLAENPASVERMGKAARNLVLGNYTWDAIAHSMLSAYEKIPAESQ